MRLRIMDRMGDVADGAMAVGVVALVAWTYVGLPILVCYTVIKVVSMLV